MGNTPTDALWSELSREELASGLVEWSRSARRAAITAFVASRTESPLQPARISRALDEDLRFVTEVMEDLGRQGVLVKQEGGWARSGDDRLLEFVEACCRSQASLAEKLRTLSRWAHAPRSP